MTSQTTRMKIPQKTVKEQALPTTAKKQYPSVRIIDQKLLENTLSLIDCCSNFSCENSSRDLDLEMMTIFILGRSQFQNHWTSIGLGRWICVLILRSKVCWKTETHIFNIAVLGLGSVGVVHIGTQGRDVQFSDSVNF